MFPKIRSILPFPDPPHPDLEDLLSSVAFLSVGLQDAVMNGLKHDNMDASKVIDPRSVTYLIPRLDSGDNIELCVESAVVALQIAHRAMFAHSGDGLSSDVAAYLGWNVAAIRLDSVYAELVPRPSRDVKQDLANTLSLFIRHLDLRTKQYANIEKITNSGNGIFEEETIEQTFLAWATETVGGPIGINGTQSFSDAFIDSIKVSKIFDHVKVL